MGEGRTAQQGLLRFVLEGEGFEVARETRTIADLAIAIADEQPDVVVLDDGIGVVAVSMVHEALPRTKVVLVWPSAVVPIGGDARVEPSRVLKDLGPAVRHVAPVGVGAGVTETFDRPEWIDKVRKDPATLRDKLAGRGADAKRPSVTQLQQRGRRLHPVGRRRPEVEEPASAAVVAFPAATAAGPPPTEVTDGDAVEGLAGGEIVERSEWNRRLGTLALSGAAAVSALVLALALGGGRGVSPVIRGADGFLPPGSGLSTGGGQVNPSTGGSSLGGGGYWPIPIVLPVPEAPAVGPSGSNGGDFLGPSTGSPETPTQEPPVEEPGGGGNGGGGNGNGGGGNGGGNGGGGGGGGGVAKPEGNVKNPFGGPPSQLGLTPAHGAGIGTTYGVAADHARSGHAHKH